VIRFGQNQNLASPKTFDLLRLCWWPKLPWMYYASVKTS